MYLYDFHVRHKSAYFVRASTFAGFFGLVYVYVKRLRYKISESYLQLLKNDPTQ